MTRTRRGQEHGYTLIELLIVMALSVVVVGGPMAFVVLALTQQNVSSSRSAAVEQESVGMSRFTRDLRQVVPSTTSTFTWNSTGTSATASMTLPVPGSGGASTETVVWSCTAAVPPLSTGTCTRQVNSGSAIPEVTGVSSVTFSPVNDTGSALTSPATNPAYVGITMKVFDISQLDAGQTHTVTGITNPIVLEDGVALRNNT
jgi:prepilin-type N-terminal cleavage/methylation domain-containing protein